MNEERKASGRREPAVRVADSRLPDAFFLSLFLKVDASEGRDARRANSRGFLNPWNNRQEKEMASAKTRTGGEGCRFASSRRLQYAVAI